MGELKLLVGILCLLEAVGRESTIRTIMVLTHNLLAIDWQPLERVHGNQDGASACVDVIKTEPVLNIGQDGGLIEGVEVIHVLYPLRCTLGHTGKKPVVVYQHVMMEWRSGVNILIMMIGGMDKMIDLPSG